MFGHVIGMALNTQVFNLLNTGVPVRTKDETGQSGKYILELVAVLRIIELLAISAGQILVLNATHSDLAPLHSLILMTAGAPLS